MSTAVAPNWHRNYRTLFQARIAAFCAGTVLALLKSADLSKVFIGVYLSLFCLKSTAYVKLFLPFACDF